MTTLLPLFRKKGLSLKKWLPFFTLPRGLSFACTQKSTALQEHDTDVTVLCALKASWFEPPILLLLTHGRKQTEYTCILRTAICLWRHSFPNLVWAQHSSLTNLTGLNKCAWAILQALVCETGPLERNSMSVCHPSKTDEDTFFGDIHIHRSMESSFPWLSNSVRIMYACWVFGMLWSWKGDVSKSNNRLITIQNYCKTRFIGATNVQKIQFLTILIDGDNFWLDKLLPIVWHTKTIRRR